MTIPIDNSDSDKSVFRCSISFFIIGFTVIYQKDKTKFTANNSQLYLFCINVDYLHNTSTDKENLVFKRQVFLYLVFVVNLRFPQLCSNFLSSSWWPAWKHLDKIKKISVSLKEQEIWMSFSTNWGANWRSVRESRVKNRAKLAPDWFSLVNNGMFRHCVS